MSKIARIGTRESRLAVIQAELVAAAIQASNPDIVTELVKIRTLGDKILDRTPDKIGGKGVFVKELDEALRRGDVDICVHSYKDVPQEDDKELPIVAVGEREDPRDVLILPPGVKSPDAARPIGCSSQRRQVQLRALYPGHEIAPVRGNVLTRLEKLDRGEYAALVLAAAGIKRLGLWERVNRAFSPGEMLPAGCQGVLAVQGRRGEDYSYLDAFENSEARIATTAERAFVRRLGWGCGSPIGVFGELEGEALRLRGMIAGDNNKAYYDEISGQSEDAEALGVRLAEKMLAGVRA